MSPRPGQVPRGSEHWAAKLTEADVLHIATSGESSGVLAKRFEINPKHVRDIRAGRKWTWLVRDGV